MVNSANVSKRITEVGLIAVLTLALLIRLWGIGFGLPYATHPDEARFVMTAVRILQTGDLNPGWFLQPSLYSYLVTCAIAVYFLRGVSKGVFVSVQDLFQPPYHFWGKIPYPGEFLVPRVMTALIGVASIWALYELGRRVADRRVGLLSALFLALSYHHVSSSHFITTDVLCTFLILAAVIYSWLAWQEGRMRWYALAGLIGGLSLSTKYSAFPVLLPLLVAHFFRWRDGKVSLMSQELIVGLTAFVVGFLSGTPYALFDLPNLLDGVAYELRHHHYLGHPGAEGQTGLWFFTHLMGGSERWLTAVGLVGSVLGFPRNTRRMLFLLSFPVAYYVVMSANRVRFERFLVPLMPFLALSAAIFLDEVLLPRLARFHWEKWGAWGLVLPLCVEPAVAVTLYDSRLASEDVRITAAHWIEENLPAGTVVAVERFGSPLSDEQFTLVEPYYMIDHDLEWYREQGVTYFVFGDISYQRFLDQPAGYPGQTAQYEELFSTLELVRDFEGPFIGWAGHHVLLYRWPER